MSPRPVPSLLRNKGGYTVMEALIAILIISIMALPLYRLLNTEKRVSVRARDKFTAYLLASGEMERLKSLDVKTKDLYDAEKTVEINGKRFNLKRSIKGRFEEYGTLTDEAGEGIKEITASVSLNDKKLAVLTGLFGGLEGSKKDTTLMTIKP